MLRIGSYVTYTPYSVIAGFTSGIGVMMVLSMVNTFLGEPVKITKPLNAIQKWPDALESLNSERTGHRLGRAGRLVVVAQATAQVPARHGRGARWPEPS